MNFNGNNAHLQHAIDLLRRPKNLSELQLAYNKKRLARVEKGFQVAPVFIPLQFTLSAAGQVSAFNKSTPPLAYDVVITSIICDAPTDRDLVIREQTQDLPLGVVGDTQNLYLRCSDLWGGNGSAVNGQKNPFTLSAPLLLSANNRLTVGLFKSDITAADELVNVVFIGFRLLNNLSAGHVGVAAIEQALNRRRLARQVVVKQAVDYPSAAAGATVRNVYFPQTDEPLIVRGARTNLEQSFITVNVQGQPQWTAAKTPVWAVAQRLQNNVDSYLWLQRPVILAPNEVIECTFENSIDGVTLDDQTGNYFSWICETV